MKMRNGEPKGLYFRAHAIGMIVRRMRRCGGHTSGTFEAHYKRTESFYGET